MHDSICGEYFALHRAVVRVDSWAGNCLHGIDVHLITFYTQSSAKENWTNEVTLRSTRAARSYEPGIWAPRVSPTPLLLVVALQDTVTVTDLALRAYENSLEPKRLVTLRGGHFTPYEKEFETASAAALSWFQQHL